MRSGAVGWNVRTVTDEPSFTTRLGKITRLRLVSAMRRARASPSRATSSARSRSISGFASSPYKGIHFATGRPRKFSLSITAWPLPSTLPTPCEGITWPLAGFGISTPDFFM